MAKQCIEDLTERYPEESEQLELVELIRTHLDNSKPPTTGQTVTEEDLERIHREDEEREEDRTGGDEVYEDDAFVNDGGRRGGGEGEERDLDEDVEEI